MRWTQRINDCISLGRRRITIQYGRIERIEDNDCEKEGSVICPKLRKYTLTVFYCYGVVRLKTLPLRGGG